MHRWAENLVFYKQNENKVPGKQHASFWYYGIQMPMEEKLNWKQLKYIQCNDLTSELP